MRMIKELSDFRQTEVDKKTALLLLRKMREIRQFQEEIIKIYPTDVMVTPVHLHIGEEAVPVGVCANLLREDEIFFGHRTHGPALAKGMDMKVLMAELYGRTTGCSKGHGGSMHVIDVQNGMLGSSSIVGGNISLGVGGGLAAKLMNADFISVSYFGDGATDSGVFWESINFAALKNIPVLFVCENNELSNVMHYSDHMFVSLPSVVKEFMPTFQADGTDVLSVYHSAKQAIALVRQNRKPVYLECKTKRWMKHQGVDKDDLSYNLIDKEKDCPIHKLESYILENKIATREEIEKIIGDVGLMIKDAIEFAVNSPFPSSVDLLSEV